MEFIIHFFKAGGIIVWIIAGFSVVALAIFLERFFSIRKDKVLPQDLLERVKQLVNDKKFDEAIQVCSVQKTGIARLANEILSHRNWAKLDLRAHAEDVGRQEIQRLTQNTGFLGTTASVCPLLGLMGTVYGMIQTFSVIQGDGMGQMNQLAGGISLALYTTAAGLTVAVPAFLGYRFITARVESVATAMEDFSVAIMEKLSR